MSHCMKVLAAELFFCDFYIYLGTWDQPFQLLTVKITISLVVDDDAHFILFLYIIIAVYAQFIYV